LHFSKLLILPYPTCGENRKAKSKAGSVFWISAQQPFEVKTLRRIENDSEKTQYFSNLGR
jgi:hypothetical protein